MLILIGDSLRIFTVLLGSASLFPLHSVWACCQKLVSIWLCLVYSLGNFARLGVLSFMGCDMGMLKDGITNPLQYEVR